MKKLIFLFTAVLYLTSFICCDNRQTEKAETPDALQDDKLDITSYNRTGDLVEELYQELVEKSPTLKNLEADIKTFRQEQNELTEKFYKYNHKSNSYYESAYSKVTTITDSLLRSRIITLLSNSEKQYSNKTAELNSLLQRISNNESTIIGHHYALKIVLTLPLIEKYQNENLLDKTEFKDLIKTQEKLINQIESLIPKF
jgi:predicted transcriptional regulator